MRMPDIAMTIGTLTAFCTRWAMATKSRHKLTRVSCGNPACGAQHDAPSIVEHTSPDHWWNLQLLGWENHKRLPEILPPSRTGRTIVCVWALKVRGRWSRDRDKHSSSSWSETQLMRRRWNRRGVSGGARLWRVMRPGLAAHSKMSGFTRIEFGPFCGPFFLFLPRDEFWPFWGPPFACDFPQWGWGCRGARGNLLGRAKSEALWPQLGSRF